MIRNLLQKQIETTDWIDFWNEQLKQDYFTQLLSNLDDEHATYEVYPAKENIFNFLRLTKLSELKVVILGQDPYHTPGMAHGLAFSVDKGAKWPPSLKNIFKELETDTGVKRENPNLSDWAQQGVLLMNSTLTVRRTQANSHSNLGWNQFTHNLIKYIVEQKTGIIFILWGKYAESKASLINDNHEVIISSHPSPFSARKSFFGSKPFSTVNTILLENDSEPIHW